MPVTKTSVDDGHGTSAIEPTEPVVSSAYRAPTRTDTSSASAADRRRLERGVVSNEPSRPQLVALILGTYLEIPGLSLHAHQAARLLGLREAVCSVVLNDLVRDGQLRQSEDGRYRRP